MPAPARTSVDDIVSAARQIVERRGVDALTMQEVAATVGVRAPSLYKRVGGRDDLVRRISTQVAVEIGVLLDEATGSDDPERDLRAMMAAHRRFANANPRTYALLFGPVPEAWRISDALNARMNAGLIATVSALAGPSHALDAARFVVAWGHGFVTMELAGAFRLGGDVEAAFAYGVDAVVAAVKAGARVRPRTES